MSKEDILIARYLNQDLDTKETEELDQLLKVNPKLRDKFYQQANAHAGLETEFSSVLPDEKLLTLTPKFSKTPWFTIAACLVLSLSLLSFFWMDEDDPIALIIANENAAWESSLPTTQGSKLYAGRMTLKSGVSIIRFSSGAELTLEAPAMLELVDSMHGILHQGNGIVNVPDSAQGFVLTTPTGYAVDHGTAFGVSVSQDGKLSDFKVLEGEISIHASNGKSLFLLQNESASLSATGISDKNVMIAGEPVPEPTKQNQLIRFQTEGRCQSIIRNNKIAHLNPDYLMVKLDTGSYPYERRSLFNFQIGETDVSRVKQVRLRLNLVPCGLGYRVYLPKVNQFQVYAIAGFSEIESWRDLKWEEAPSIESATLIGNFEIPRSQERGSVVIESQELTNFLKENNTSEYTFIVTRQTTEIRGSGMVHAFASDSHPEASGPTLEITF